MTQVQRTFRKDTLMLSQYYDALLDRFTRYVKIDTQSDPECPDYPNTYPSTQTTRSSQSPKARMRSHGVARRRMRLPRLRHRNLAFKRRPRSQNRRFHRSRRYFPRSQWCKRQTHRPQKLSRQRHRTP